MGHNNPSLWRHALLLASIGSIVLLLSLSPVPGQLGLSALDLPHTITRPSQTQTRPRIYTTADCDAEFPLLYRDIDRAVKYWRRRNHTIGPDDISAHPLSMIIDDEGGARFVYADKVSGPSIDRTLSFASMIKRVSDEATLAGEKLPSIQASVQVSQDEPGLEDDDDTKTVWAYTKEMQKTKAFDRVWLWPDHQLYGDKLQTIEQAREYARSHDRPFRDKIQKAYWKGVTWTNPKIRDGLLKVAKKKSWANITSMDWGKSKSFTPPDEACKYAMTVYTEGITQSGRMGQLLQCDSVMIAHEMVWPTHYQHLLEAEGPNQNYVSVKRDWSDMEEKVQWLLNNPERAQQIAENSLKTFRRKYLTGQATRCYARKLIAAYATVSEPPVLERPDGRRRGVSVDAFLITGLQWGYNDTEAYV